MSEQLDLMPRPRGAGSPWVTGGRVDRSGPARYVHLIRAPDDPERSPRKGRKDKGTSWRELAKRPLDDVREEIAAHLADGRPRTFNRIGVELWDKTADVLLDSNVDEALWAMVDDGLVEHTLAAPILFRRRSR